jgi:uncharacterized protein DUF2183
MSVRLPTRKLLFLLSLFSVLNPAAADALTPEKTAQQVRRLVSGPTNRVAEGKILRLLTQERSIDTTLSLLDLERLVSSMEDHLTGADNRTALVRLLTEERLQELSIENRARLVTALQIGRTGNTDEKGLVAIFLSTRGPDLTRLKNLVDGGSDQYDLQHLVESDLDIQADVDTLLEHFALQTPEAPVGLKLISDIDDTVYANWTDQRYPSKTVYPGVLAFYREISDSPPVFLTARPHERTGTVKSTTHQTLKSLGVVSATVLTGSLRRLQNNEAMATEKLENFELYSKLFPEYLFCFVGDSGQGDGQVGEAMRRRFPRLVPAVFLHDVVGLDEEQKRDYRDLGIFVFETYPQAAKLAVEQGLMTISAAEIVSREARTELETITFDSETQKRSVFDLFR